MDTFYLVQTYKGFGKAGDPITAIKNYEKFNGKIKKGEKYIFAVYEVDMVDKASDVIFYQEGGLETKGNARIFHKAVLTN